MEALDGRLTITIPTYNRWDQLNTVLTHIQGSGDSCYSVIVNDNNSDIFSEESLLGGYKEIDLAVYRNKENLGVVRNAIESIKRVDTQYMLIHSDDDPYSNELIHDALLEFSRGRDYVAVGATSIEIDCNGDRLPLYPARRTVWFYPLSQENRILRRIYYYLLPLSTGKANFFYSVFDKNRFNSINTVLDIFNDKPLLFFDEMLVFCALSDGPIKVQNGFEKRLLQGNIKNYARAENGIALALLETVSRIKFYYLMSDWRERIPIIALAPVKILIELLSKLQTSLYRHIAQSR